MFQVGQMVQCVDDEVSNKYMPPGYMGYGNGLDGLRLNSVYTVRSVRAIRGTPQCRLMEIIRHYDWIQGEEAYFACERFRPLTERKTDISVFRSLLDPTKQRVST